MRTIQTIQTSKNQLANSSIAISREIAEVALVIAQLRPGWILQPYDVQNWTLLLSAYDKEILHFAALEFCRQRTSESVSAENISQFAGYIKRAIASYNTYTRIHHENKDNFAISFASGCGEDTQNFIKTYTRASKSHENDKHDDDDDDDYNDFLLQAIEKSRIRLENERNAGNEQSYKYWRSYIDFCERRKQ
jgi:hypothetical protein